MTPSFDDRNIQWQRFGEFEPAFYFNVLNVDEPRRIADVLFKLPASAQIVLHRHCALNNTFVIQGEHRLYETDGTLREIRPTGSYTISPAAERPHREGGGAQDVVIHFSIRPDQQELIYQLLDDHLEVIGTVSFQDLVALYRQREVGVAA